MQKGDVVIPTAADRQWANSGAALTSLASSAGLRSDPPLFTITDDEDQNDGDAAANRSAEEGKDVGDDVGESDVARSLFADSSSVTVPDSPPDLSLLTTLSGVNEMDSDDVDSRRNDSDSRSADPLNECSMYDDIFASDNLITSTPTDGGHSASKQSGLMSMPDSQHHLTTLTPPPFNSYRWWTTVGQGNDVDDIGSTEHQRQLHQHSRYSHELDNLCYSQQPLLPNNDTQSMSHHLRTPTTNFCETGYQPQPQQQHLYPFMHQAMQPSPCHLLSYAVAAASDAYEPYSILPDAPAMSNDCHPRYNNPMQSRVATVMDSGDNSRVCQYWPSSYGARIQQPPPQAPSVYPYTQMPSSMSHNIFGNGFQTTSELPPPPSYLSASSVARPPPLLQVDQGETLPPVAAMPVVGAGADKAAQLTMNSVMERLDSANSLLNLSQQQQQQQQTTTNSGKLRHCAFPRSLTPPLPLTTAATTTTTVYTGGVMTTCLPSFTSTFGSCAKCIENTRKRKPPATVRELLEQRSKEKMSATSNADATVFVPSAVFQVLPLPQPYSMPQTPSSVGAQICCDRPVRFPARSFTPPLTPSMVATATVAAPSSSDAVTSPMVSGEVIRPVATAVVAPNGTGSNQVLVEVTNRQQPYRIPIYVVQATRNTAGNLSVPMADWQVLFDRPVRPPPTDEFQKMAPIRAAVDDDSRHHRELRPSCWPRPIRPPASGGQVEVAAGTSLLREALLSTDSEPPPVRPMPSLAAAAVAGKSKPRQSSSPCILSLLKSSNASKKRLPELDAPLPNKSASTAKPTMAKSSSPTMTSSNKDTSLSFRTQSYDMDFVSIGTFKSPLRGNPKTANKFKVVFTKKRFVYEFTVPSVQLVRHDRTTPHLVTVDVPFDTVNAVHCNQRLILVSVTMPPTLYVTCRPSGGGRSSSALCSNCHLDRNIPTDITDGQLKLNHLHKIHLRNCPSDILKLTLERFDSRFTVMMQTPILEVVEVKNTVQSSDAAATGRRGLCCRVVSIEQAVRCHLLFSPDATVLPADQDKAINSPEGHAKVICWLQTPSGSCNVVHRIFVAKHKPGRKYATNITDDDDGDASRLQRRQCVIDVIQPPSQRRVDGSVGSQHGVAQVCSLCHCQVSCRSNRCSCMKARVKCGRGETCCFCKNCDNPLNLLDSLGFEVEDCAADICLVHNIVTYKGDLVRFLERLLTFPCCGHRAKVKECIPGAVRCPNADCKAPGGGPFKFSWCDGELQDEKERPRNHCSLCRSCQGCIDLHCSACRRCNPLKTTGSKCPDCRHPRDTTYTEIRDIANVLLLLGRQDKRRLSAVAGRTGRTVRPPQVNQLHQHIRSSNVTTSTSKADHNVLNRDERSKLSLDGDELSADESRVDLDESSDVATCSAGEAAGNGDA